MISRQQLQLRMSALEGLSSFEDDSRREFDELRPAALHWVAQLKLTPLALRFSRLARRIQGIPAPREFLSEARTYFSDPALDLALAAALIEEGKDTQARDILLPLCDSPDLAVEQRVRAARQLRRTHSWSESISAFKRAALEDRQYHADLISALLGAGDRSAALSVARECIGCLQQTAAVLFACYTAYVAGSAPEREIADVRSKVLSAAAGSNDAVYWESRLFRFEHNYDAAIAALNAALKANPEDKKLLRERAAAMIQSGEWGRHAREILAAKAFLSADSDLLERVKTAEAFLATFQRQERSCDDGDPLRIPDAVFQHFSVVSQGKATSRERKRLAMVAATLGPGGAERIFAMLARRLADSGRFENIKLYFMDLSPSQRKDFYLPYIRFPDEDVFVLDRHCHVEAPLTFLPLEHARTAQAVLNRIRQDAPDIVYTALEPLTVFSALAGLIAGVPKIVMHSHNMPPTELHPRADFPERLRECYRALLKKPHISLLTCARAAADSYAEWLDCGRGFNIAHIHNGLDFTNFGPVADEERERLRAELGVGRNHLLVGTAFAFREEKQPFLWIDAAREIADKQPTCRFVMFGDGALWAQAKAYASAKGLDDRFTFPGLVSDLYRRLPALDLFMLSSRSEALPNVLIEAQAAGVPVVTTSVGGAAETFLEGKTGASSSAQSPTDLAGAALRALGNPEWRKRASACAPDFVRSQFGLDKMTHSFIEALVS